MQTQNTVHVELTEAPLTFTAHELRQRQARHIQQRLPVSHAVAQLIASLAFEPTRGVA